MLNQFYKSQSVYPLRDPICCMPSDKFKTHKNWRSTDFEWKRCGISSDH